MLEKAKVCSSVSVTLIPISLRLCGGLAVVLEWQWVWELELEGFGRVRVLLLLRRRRRQWVCSQKWLRKYTSTWVLEIQLGSLWDGLWLDCTATMSPKRLRTSVPFVLARRALDIRVLPSIVSSRISWFKEETLTKEMYVCFNVVCFAFSFSIHSNFLPFLVGNWRQKYIWSYFQRWEF